MLAAWFRWISYLASQGRFGNGIIGKFKRPCDPDLTKEEAEECYNEWKQLGQPGPDSAGSSSDNENDHKFAIPPWVWVLPFLVPFPGNPVYGGL